MDARLAVRRKSELRNEEATLLFSIDQNGEVAIYYLYDALDVTEEDLVVLRESVVADSRVDELAELPAPAGPGNYLVIEPLPGRYDQRVDAAEQALRPLRPETQAQITSATPYVFDAPVNDAMRSFLISPVELGEKNLSVLHRPGMGEIEPLKEYPGFTELDDEGLTKLLASDGMAMSLADLKIIQDYFRSEGRTPTEVELFVLDTYWSDHCRHTTFNTELTSIENNEPRLAAQLDCALCRYDELRELNDRTHKPRTLIDMGTIISRELRRTGVMDDQGVSGEINTCSVYVDVEGDDHKWPLMFKNETHNHPTEVEPFGGASTCLGDAIRDLLSSRSWVYQAMRLSGAGDINTPREQTLEGKLLQRDIPSRAAAGYSSYGNQIGLATTGVRELVHPGYVVKRMELGVVIAAAPVDNVKCPEPAPGDVVITLGGRTGRDGVDGVIGSSKAHDEDSLGRSGAEVQEGNLVNERKIQRLFRRENVATKIVRCNDFDAGGVSVAVDELAGSIGVYLERMPLKYASLNAREIAISESQKRMALVMRPEDVDFIIAAAAEENIKAVALTDITDTGRLRMFMGDKIVFDLSREPIDANDADRAQDVEMVAVEGGVAKQAPASVLESLHVATVGFQEGMIEQLDSTVGHSIVLMPYGDAAQKTDEQASIQTLPVDGGTNTASVMTWGYSPSLADGPPYLMGSYFVVEALAKLAAASGDLCGAWLSAQEYFQRLDQDPQRWGEAMQALLGLLEAQDGFQAAAIGGKDSMSGTYGEDLHVPATLVIFAVAAMDETDAVSAVIPADNFDLYPLAHKPFGSGEPNYEQLNELFAAVRELRPVAASVVANADLAATLMNMTVGNGVGLGVVLEASLLEAPLGSIVVAVPAGQVVDRVVEGAVKIDTADEPGTLRFGEESFTTAEVLEAMEPGHREVFPLNDDEGEALPEFATQVSATETALQSPGKKDVHVLLPVFPDTNSEYDMAEVFVAAGATYEFHVIRNLTPAMLAEDTKVSIEKLQDADILAFSGGFSLGDEPNRSAKFIAAFLHSDDVAAAVKEFVAGNGLVLGICSGFQALVKSDFLPHDDPAQLHEDSPILVHNRQLRYVSRIATTRVATVDSPWLRGFKLSQTHLMPASYGEGRFVVSEDEARRLFEVGQVTFQYVDADGVPTMTASANPNGSSYVIESIVSVDGRILGRMGHPERFCEGLMRNIPGISEQDIFSNAVHWVRGEQNWPGAVWRIASAAHS